MQSAKVNLFIISLKKGLPVEEVVEQNIGGKYVSVRSVEEDGEEDVYCMTMPKNGNFVANGIVVKNCDALRYAIFTHLFGRSGGPEGPMTPEASGSTLHGGNGPGTIHSQAISTARQHRRKQQFLRRGFLLNLFIVTY